MCALPTTRFLLYAQNSTPGNSPVKVLKYVDNRAIIGPIQDGDESAYSTQYLVALWCRSNSQELNMLQNPWYEI